MAVTRSRQQVCKAVARILREERLRQDISLNALAAKAGLSYQMVSYVEREMRNPTLDTLLRITGALEIDLANVLRRASQN
jgi:transcriptional regulator with XRE-family HTH domain